MKKLVFLIAFSTLIASFAWGILGEIVASFPAPANYPIALAVAANYQNYLWVYCNTPPYRVYRINGNTGTVYSSFISPHGQDTYGLTYSYGGGGGVPFGSYLWMANGETDRVYRCNYFTGSVYASFPAQPREVWGLAAKAVGDGGYRPSGLLASADWLSKSMYYKDPITGSNLASWEADEYALDIAWDWRNQVIWGGQFYNAVFAFDTNGSVVTAVKTGKDYPLGAAYTSNYLWVSTTTGSHWIWKIHCPSFMDDTNVEPASVGKVKAIFR
ncbi:MAG: hypothetical protein PVH29_14160 [Candidatus Zixiibacteriota bacterium]|jgi:hypothetical protein